MIDIEVMKDTLKLMIVVCCLLLVVFAVYLTWLAPCQDQISYAVLNWKNAGVAKQCLANGGA